MPTKENPPGSVVLDQLVGKQLAASCKKVPEVLSHCHIKNIINILFAMTLTFREKKRKGKKKI